jgi:Phasin protein
MRTTARGATGRAPATIDIGRRRGVNIAPQQTETPRRRTPQAPPVETSMDEKVTLLPQPTVGTSQQRSAAHPEDLHKLMLAGQGLIDCAQAINAEMLAFWQSRLKSGLALGGQLLESTSVDSALEVQLDYAKGAMQAYLDQSARVAGLLIHALDAGFVQAPVAAISSVPTTAAAA